MDKIEQYMPMYHKWRKGEDYKKTVLQKSTEKIDLPVKIWESKKYPVIGKRMMEILKKDISDNLLLTRFGQTYHEEVETLISITSLGKIGHKLFHEHKEEDAFNDLMNQNIPYAVTAYYMFIGDSKKNMPLRPRYMNLGLCELGYQKLEYSYAGYCRYIENLKDLQRRMGGLKLIDAHDYLWIVSAHLFKLQNNKCE